MLRQRFDEYLDEALDPAARREVEATLASDPEAARMLARMKAQRALRAAAFESYTPTKPEAKALADRVLAAMFDSPLGHVGYWLRRGAAVAAAVAVLAGTFAMGRMTAAPRIVDRVETRTVYNVVYTDNSTGDLIVKEFSTLDERNNCVKDLEQRGVTGIAVADLTVPGHL